jgi:hypothetical protein
MCWTLKSSNLNKLDKNIILVFKRGKVVCQGYRLLCGVDELRSFWYFNMYILKASYLFPGFARLYICLNTVIMRLCFLATYVLLVSKCDWSACGVCDILGDYLIYVF